MQRTPDNFQPNGAFEGYVKASLENLKERLDKLPCPDTFKRLNKVENDLSNIKGKATIIGVTAGFVAGLFTTTIKWLLGK